MAGSGDPLQEVSIILYMTLKCFSPHLAYCCRSDRSIVIEERQGGWYHFAGSRNSQESLSIRQRRYQSVSSRGMYDRPRRSIFVWRMIFSCRVCRKLPPAKAQIPVLAWSRKVHVKHWHELVASQCHPRVDWIDDFSLCRFLTTSASFDVRRWSADGLAYLTLDADVKEELVDNPAALKALFDLCQCQDAHVLYSITTIFVNLTNTYDVRKPEKEMTELANYAKQHVPQEHEKVNDCCWIQVRLKMRF